MPCLALSSILKQPKIACESLLTLVYKVFSRLGREFDLPPILLLRITAKQVSSKQV
ncbi:hypothetical protein J7L02_02830 [Candidatus Woesearchaeota archaeon]|nr:hypothetical protein [Candidatus Woesearchaeota archaeon]